MHVQSFPSTEALTHATVDLLREHFLRPSDAPQAIMLSGGNTPINAYRTLAARPATAAGSVVAFFSDERMAPADSPDSNYGNAAPMLRAWQIPEGRVIRVRTDLNVERAAQQYHEDLENFFQTGGRIVLGLLGLGPDGHTASLFTREGIEQGKDRLAIPVARTTGHDRVSVTPRLLEQIERIVFLVSGQEKAPIVRTLLENPLSIPAGMAVARARRVELWADLPSGRT